MIKLDKKDKKLIYFLSKNARMSHTQLSHKIGLSKNAVKYRIERLQKEGIITDFSAIIDLGALKCGTFTMLMKINEDIYENPEIIDYFKNHEFVNWAETLSGQWDLYVEFVYKSVSHISKIVSDIALNLSGKLNKYEVFFSEQILRVEHLIKDFYKDLDVEELPIKKGFGTGYDVDKIDKRILHLLAKNSALHYLEISRRLDLSLDVIRYRMKRLQEQGILVKFFPEISLSKLGYARYLFITQLKNISQVKMEDIKKSIQLNNNILYAFFDPITSNLIFVCAFKNSDGIDHLSRSLRRSYSDIIEKQEYLIIKEMIAFNLFPKGLLES